MITREKETSGLALVFCAEKKGDVVFLHTLSFLKRLIESIVSMKRDGEHHGMQEPFLRVHFVWPLVFGLLLGHA